MKKTLYLVLSLIALGLFYLRIHYSQSLVTTPTPTPAAAVSPNPATPNLNLSLTLSNDYFSLSYPQSASSTSSTKPDSSEWKITYSSIKQSPLPKGRSDLADGYTISITRYDAIGDNPDRNQAESDRQTIIKKCGSEHVTTLVSGKLGIYPALTYSGGCQGDSNSYYLMVADTLYRVTSLAINTPNEQDYYTSTIKSILDTLKFN